MPNTVSIGCWAAFWGDTRGAAEQILGRAEVDYLVSDYLSEITMALLARARSKDPDAGFVKDAVTVLAPLLEQIHARGIKVVTNAGALNPAACARAFEEAAEVAGVSLRIAAVEGDDLTPRLEDVLATEPTDMFTGEPVPSNLMTMNAYLGARPVAAALGAGADIVVTGRCVDSAVVLGPLLHEFGWKDTDYDLLSAGSLAGHIVECGPQCTGGNFTDWASVPGWEDMGFPIIECRADGTATVTKPEGTGGLVSVGSVGEQILYEIGDPGAYVMPDVVCDWRGVTLEQEGPDRVAISGARGSAPPSTYKTTATYVDGFRVMTTAMFAGVDAAGKARRTGHALIARVERLLEAGGHEPLLESSVEVVGAGDTLGEAHRNDAATEAVVKIGARHADKAALEIFSTEYAPMALVAQGMTGFFAGRPRVAPSIAVFHVLLGKSEVPAQFRIGDDVHAVEVSSEYAPETPRTPPLDDVPSSSPSGVTVPLRQIAYARSGDKGNQANIGLMARRPEFASIIHEQVGAERVAGFFAHYLDGPVRRWDLPGLSAVNYLLDGVLGGRGGTSTLRYDPQAKSYGAMLLELPVTVPAEWEASGLLAGPAVSA